jgi:hypothetical protein
MLLYNVTTKVDRSIAEAWVSWANEEHIPDVVHTGCFSKAVLLRLLETDDAEGPTYAIQFYAESKALYNLYIEKYAGIMRQKSFDKWGDKFISFRSLMQFVN